jgi:hypothetical protein
MIKKRISSTIIINHFKKTGDTANGIRTGGSKNYKSSVRLIDEKTVSDIERWWYLSPSMRALWA